MSDTPLLQLPYLAAGQAQKHITHNEALDRLDTLVQLSVIDRNLSAPPLNPVEGDSYIIPAGATAAWSGHAMHIASFRAGNWQYLAPGPGWLAWLRDEARFVVFTGSAWIGTVGSQTPELGVSATPDEINRFAVASPASLFNHAGTGHQLKINKQAAAETGAVLFQTAFSGRAELGLLGSDDFALKTSNDGVLWREALVVDRSTGRVRFPMGGAREQLYQSRTYYVRPDGADANTGHSNTSSGAFLTVQRALNAAMALDIGLYPVEIRLAPGSYAGAVLTGPPLGSGSITLRGDTANPAAVILSGAADVLTLTNGARLTIRDLKLQSTSGSALVLLSGATLEFAGLEFGACGNAHIFAEIASVNAIGAYRISGGAGYHALAQTRSRIKLSGAAVTLVGAPAFSGSFAFALSQGIVETFNCTFSGTATGQRFYAGVGGLIYTGSGNSTFLPGSTPGAVDASTFSIYV